MIQIEQEKCIGCGQCVQDCVGHALKLEDGKAKVKRDCILCGHCAAVCPVEAVSITEYTEDQMIPYKKETFDLDPDVYSNAVKFRRSIRNYKDRRIERETILRLLDVAAHTATAKNDRKMKFIVVQDRLEEFKELIFQGLKEELEAHKGEKSQRMALLYSFYKGRAKEPKDEFLFRNAPAVLYIMGERLDDAGLAAQNMEMMARAMGLGVLYNGYLKAATMCSKKARTFVDKEERPVAICMLIGYPAVTYKRTAPRKKAEYEIL